MQAPTHDGGANNSFGISELADLKVSLTITTYQSVMGRRLAFACTILTGAGRMSSALGGPAGNIVQVAAWLRDAAAEDDGSLRRRHGTSRQVDSYINQRARLSLQLFGNYVSYLRPFAEVNFNQLYTGAFHESGAGPLNLIVPGSEQFSGTAGIGFEFGGEIDLGGFALARPFVGYEFKDAIIGRSQTIFAGLEGAPPASRPSPSALQPTPPCTSSRPAWTC